MKILEIVMLHHGHEYYEYCILLLHLLLTMVSQKTNITGIEPQLRFQSLPERTPEGGKE